MVYLGDRRRRTRRGTQMARARRQRTVHRDKTHTGYREHGHRSVSPVHIAESVGFYKKKDVSSHPIKINEQSLDQL